MPTYKVTAINVGSFNLGESDRLLTLFSAERGLIKAVAKGARRPGARMSARSELLQVNNLMLNTGRSLDIITQAETIETFAGLRTDLSRLSFALYYAELTHAFAQGLEQESDVYFKYLVEALHAQVAALSSPSILCLKFELGLLEMLGLKPELDYCVRCRTVLTEFNLSRFQHEWGGILCRACFSTAFKGAVREDEGVYSEAGEIRSAVHITPLVWKHLVLAANDSADRIGNTAHSATHPSVEAARRLIQHYIEYRAGKRMKALDLISSRS